MIIKPQQTWYEVKYDINYTEQLMEDTDNRFAYIEDAKEAAFKLASKLKKGRVVVLEADKKEEYEDRNFVSCTVKKRVAYAVEVEERSTEDESI